MPDVQATNRRNLRFHVPDVSIPVQSKRRQNTVLNGRASVFRHKRVPSRQPCYCPRRRMADFLVYILVNIYGLPSKNLLF